MRRKLFLGMFLATIVGIVAGDYLINRSGAQDALPKTTDDKKSDGNLFDILKKDLEGKKEVPAPDLFKLPPLATPPVVPQSFDGKDDLQPANAPKPALPLPTPQKVEEPRPTFTLPAAGLNTEPIPPPIVTTPPEPKPSAKETLPPAQSIAPPHAISPPLKTEPVSPPQQLDFFERTELPGKAKVPQVDPTPAVQVAPMQPIVDQIAKLKNCPWSLQIEMVDGQTIVSATVNKKHEFKIVCQSLDLQTGKGTLKASGKVQITGDALNGSCEHLAIGLHDDRLILEGGAQVSIQKLSSNVSDTKPAAFELKGETLNLRISELEGKFLQTSWRRTDDGNIRQAAATTGDSKQWSRYGKLVRHETRLGSELALEDSNGATILHLVTREGGTLDQYIGQTISVYGMNENTPRGAVLRVTHIALP